MANTASGKRMRIAEVMLLCLLAFGQSLTLSLIAVFTAKPLFAADQAYGPLRIADGRIQEAALLALHLPHQQLDDASEAGGGEVLPRQDLRDLAVAQARAQQAGQARGRRRPEGTNEIVGVQIKKRLVYSRILP